MSNPRKKNRKRKANPFAKAAKARVSRRRRNPVWLVKRNGRRRNGRRGNPFSIAGNSTTGMLKLALGAGAGAVAVRGGTQLVLKSKNEGVTGYVANAVVAMVAAYFAGKFLGTDVGNGVLAGGFAATVQRIWDEKVSKVLPAAVAAATGGPPTTATMGDVSYSEDGLGRLRALGQYFSASFPLTTEGSPYVATPPALPATGTGGPVSMPSGSRSGHKPKW